MSYWSTLSHGSNRSGFPATRPTSSRRHLHRRPGTTARARPVAVILVGVILMGVTPGAVRPAGVRPRAVTPGSESGGGDTGGCRDAKPTDPPARLPTWLATATVPAPPMNPPPFPAVAAVPGAVGLPAAAETGAGRPSPAADPTLLASPAAAIASPRVLIGPPRSCGLSGSVSGDIGSICRGQIGSRRRRPTGGLQYAGRAGTVGGTLP